MTNACFQPLHRLDSATEKQPVAAAQPRPGHRPPVHAGGSPAQGEVLEAPAVAAAEEREEAEQVQQRGDHETAPFFPDQSREINHLAGGWSFGEGQPNLPADADREWRCYRAGARGLLLQPLLDGGTLPAGHRRTGPSCSNSDPRDPGGRFLLVRVVIRAVAVPARWSSPNPKVMPSPPGGPHGARRRLAITGPLSPEHGNRVSTGPCGDGRTEVGAPPRRDIAEDGHRSGLTKPVLPRVPSLD